MRFAVGSGLLAQKKAFSGPGGDCARTPEKTFGRPAPDPVHPRKARPCAGTLGAAKGIAARGIAPPRPPFSGAHPPPWGGRKFPACAAGGALV